MIYKTEPKKECYVYDSRCQGWVDYNDFRVYDKETNTVYETKTICSKVTGVSANKIHSDMQGATHRFNRIGNAFYDRKYNYYNCEENFSSKYGRNREES